MRKFQILRRSEYDYVGIFVKVIKYLFSQSYVNINQFSVLIFMDEKISIAHYVIYSGTILYVFFFFLLLDYFHKILKYGYVTVK